MRSHPPSARPDGAPTDDPGRASRWTTSGGSPLTAGLAFLATRLVLGAGVLLWAALARTGPETHPLADGTWWLDRFAYWDSYHYLRIAEDGYFAPGRDCCDQAFFPGYPLALRALSPLVGGHTVAAGLVITLLAGIAAASALWGLTRDRWGASAADRAVVALAVAPYGVFLIAVYTEATFLAAALGAWWAASRGRWWWAAACCAVAVSVRVNGLFVLAGLVVMYAVQQARAHRRGVAAGRSAQWHHLGAVVLALGPLVAHVIWLHERTGSWDAWREAQARGWKRRSMLPWEAIWHQVGEIVGAPSPWLTLTRSLDLVVVLLGLALLVTLLCWRWWPEAVYLALSVAVLLTTSTLDSTGRYALTWFPAYLVLARLGGAERGSWGRRVWWLAICAALVALPVLTGLFVHRRWLG